MLHKYLAYLELDIIPQSTVDSGDFCRVIAFLFDDRNGLRHVSLFSEWYLKIFESIEDMESLRKILSSFKHCTQLISIAFCRCVFSDRSYNDRETISIESDFRKWLNDNTHLTFEKNFYLECDKDNKVLKLWLG
jgi:hypothetical protein